MKLTQELSVEDHNLMWQFSGSTGPPDELYITHIPHQWQHRTTRWVLHYSHPSSVAAQDHQMSSTLLTSLISGSTGPLDEFYITHIPHQWQHRTTRWILHYSHPSSVAAQDHQMSYTLLTSLISGSTGPPDEFYITHSSVAAQDHPTSSTLLTHQWQHKTTRWVLHYSHPSSVAAQDHQMSSTLLSSLMMHFTVSR